MRPKETIERFDNYLAERGLRLEAVIVGGSALGLLGITTRQTRDCGILQPELPPKIKKAARAFAARQTQDGNALAEDWLNNGPSSLTRDLPPGWEDRLQLAYDGKAVTFHCLGRMDLLRSKIFALCDRGVDLQDCIALNPTRDEIEEIGPWLAQRDANPDWPAHTQEVLRDLAGRLGHGV